VSEEFVELVLVVLALPDILCVEVMEPISFSSDVLMELSVLPMEDMSHFLFLSLFVSWELNYSCP
jgi:hypothetical protein